VLKNYLSPSIKEFLPEYSRKYGFDYEYVQGPILQNSILGRKLFG
jgi:hypothetical protein